MDTNIFHQELCAVRIKYASHCGKHALMVVQSLDDSSLFILEPVVPARDLHFCQLHFRGDYDGAFFFRGFGDLIQCMSRLRTAAQTRERFVSQRDLDWSSPTVQHLGLKMRVRLTQYTNHGTRVRYKV